MCTRRGINAGRGAGRAEWGPRPATPSAERGSAPAHWGEMDFRDLRNKLNPKWARPGCADAAAPRSGAPERLREGAGSRAGTERQGEGSGARRGEPGPAAGWGWGARAARGDQGRTGRPARLAAPRAPQRTAPAPTSPESRAYAGGGGSGRDAPRAHRLTLRGQASLPAAGRSRHYRPAPTPTRQSLAASRAATPKLIARGPGASPELAPLPRPGAESDSEKVSWDPNPPPPRRWEIREGRFCWDLPFPPPSILGDSCRTWHLVGCTF